MKSGSHACMASTLSTVLFQTRNTRISLVSPPLSLPIPSQTQSLQTAPALWAGVQRTLCCHLPVMLTLVSVSFLVFFQYLHLPGSWLTPHFSLRALLWTASMITIVFHPDQRKGLSKALLGCLVSDMSILCFELVLCNYLFLHETVSSSRQKWDHSLLWMPDFSA